MQSKPISKKRGRHSLWEIRFMITALAVAATLGFWNLFSKQMVLSQAAQVQPADPTLMVQPQELVIALPPMPTLIPAEAGNDILASMPAIGSQTAALPDQSFQAGTKILLGGSAPQLRRSAPAPVTTTRSSR